MPKHLPQDIALCLFRVTQEALHNAVKHSYTRDFAVEVKGEADTVQLEVRDWGQGFDVEEAMRDRGLGLVSMQERVNLVNGKFSIESNPMEGTKIMVIVPLIVEQESSPEADAANETVGRTGQGLRTTDTSRARQSAASPAPLQVPSCFKTSR